MDALCQVVLEQREKDYLWNLVLGSREAPIAGFAPMELPNLGIALAFASQFAGILLHALEGSKGIDTFEMQVVVNAPTEAEKLVLEKLMVTALQTPTLPEGDGIESTTELFRTTLEKLALHEATTGGTA